MSDCIFCKIVSGQLPCYQIYEDDLFLGFLDIKPKAIGNSLLIPKTHYRWVYGVPEFGLYWEAAKKIALASIKATNAISISFLTLGFEVPHAHIRIIPRFENDAHQDGINIHHLENLSADQMQQISQKIKSLLS